MSRVALYARYSSDNQRDASIEDQLRQCRERAAREGWTVVDSYSDRAISGASLIRSGIQELLADAQAGRFDMVLSEALDRISRDQEDVAAVFKRLRFAGATIVTLSEGEISELHVGLKGTMNALFLKNLALKTHRGIRGRVEAGKIGGGNAYGYRVVKTLDASDEPVRGEREIIDEQAEVVRRIFREYVAGKGPQKIAADLNRESIPSPTGKRWSDTTIRGNRAYAQETNRLNRERRMSGETTRRALADTEKAIAEIVRVIEQGGYHRALSARLTELEARQDELNARRSEVPADLPDIHPNIGDIYRRRIERLTEALNHPDDAREAAEALREVIDRIVISPGEKRGDLQITLHGDLDTIVEWVARTAKSGYKAKHQAASSRLSVSVKGRARPGHDGHGGMIQSDRVLL